MPLAYCLSLVAAFVLVAVVARPADRDEAGRVVDSVFFIAKSENKNEVHYGVTLDESCSPSGAAPVFPYWRMREHGPQATEPLLPREVPAYGIRWQRVVSRTDHGGRVVFSLNAIPGREIAIDSAMDGDACVATARIMIDNTAASLTAVFVQLRWPFGVDYLLLQGRASDDGRPLRERLSP